MFTQSFICRGGYQRTREFFSRSPKNGAIFLKVVVIAMGFFSICIGLLAIYGWHTNNLTLIQIQPRLIAIHYNLGIAFLICGAAFIFISMGQEKIAGYIGVLVLLYGFLLLIQYLLGIDFGLEHPLLTSPLTHDLAKITRITVGGAYSLCMVGMAFILIAVFKQLKHSFLFLLTISSIIIARSVMICVHNLVGVHMPLVWFHAMSVPTAIGFFIISIGILAYIYTEKPPRIYSVHWLPVACAAGALSIAFSFWQAQVTKDRFRLSQVLTLHGLNMSHQIELSLDTRIQALNHMARNWISRGRPTQSQWVSESQSIINDYLGFQVVSWIDSSFHLQWLEPDFDVNNMIDKQQEISELLRAVTQKAWEQKKVVIAEMDRVSGRSSEFVAVVPILKGKVFDGFIVGSFNQRNLFSAILHGPSNDDFSIHIDFDEKNFYEAHMPTEIIPLEWSAPIPINVHNLIWQLRIAPTQKFLQENRSYLAEATLIGGVLLSLFLGVVIYFLQSLRRRARILQSAKEILQRSQEKLIKLAAIVESSEDAIIGTTLEGYITSWNGGAEKIYGYKKEEILGLSIAVLFPPGHTEELNEKLEKIKNHKHIYDHEAVRVHKDGRLIHVSVTVFPIKNYKGEVLGASVVARDISRRIEVERALHESQELFHSFMNNSPTLAFMKDEQGRYVYVNQTFERLQNLKLDDIKGKTAYDWLPDYVAAELQKNDQAVFEANKMIETVDRVPLSDGVIHDWLVFRFPLKVADEQRYVGGVAVDISERRKAEEIIRRTNAELELRVLERTKALDVAIQNMQAEIMARKRIEKELAKRAEELAASNQELEQFALVASHDLQEPLRKISSYSELLAHRYKGRLDEKADKFIGYMVDGVHRMQNLIKGLLIYARVGKTDVPLHRVDLKKVVHFTMNDLESSIQENNAEIIFENLPTVWANPAQMGQLMQNLIANALKFRSKESPRIHISANQRDHEWVVSISDNGIGIEPEHIEKIFQIFQRLHSQKEFPGTGIGLAICKKIVERHGGHIWVQSVKGQGTTFFFSLPVRTETPAPTVAHYG